MQGMGSAKEDIIKLIGTYKPVVIAGQNTFYGDDFISNLAGYLGICKQGHFNRRYHGGVVLYINRACPYRMVNVEGDYQIVATQVNISPGTRVTIGSMYIPPRAEFVEGRVKDMLEKLPRPVILMGDLNAHHED